MVNVAYFSGKRRCNHCIRGGDSGDNTFYHTFDKTKGNSFNAIFFCSDQCVFMYPLEMIWIITVDVDIFYITTSSNHAKSVKRSNMNTFYA